MPSALAQGALACLVERDGLDVSAWGADLEGDKVASYANLKAATGPIAATFYGHPSQALSMVAVTGTNGKTSTTWWLAQALSKLKQQVVLRCGVVGTLGIGEPPALVPNGLTTPDPVTLQHALRDLVQQGVQACAIEASSIGLSERRLDGCEIKVALFTNFTHDHLDYHGSMEAYWQAKAELFRWPGLQAAVINVDDPQGVELAAQLAATRPAVAVWTCSMALPPARLSPQRAQPVAMSRVSHLYAEHSAYVRSSDPGDRCGLCFDVAEQGSAARYAVTTGLIGEYNVANVLGVIGALRAVGASLEDAAQACCDLRAVPGRMECLGQSGQPLAVIDYAHTPDALDKALAGLRPLAAQRGGQLWCLFGCGGDRDPAKRPVMAAVAQKNADQVMVTSDNPRTEKPQAIISQILLGLSHSEKDSVHVESDRAQAIARVLQEAAPADVVLIAGKGHEDYQDVAGVKHPFSDQTHALAALALRGGGTHINNKAKAGGAA